MSRTVIVRRTIKITAVTVRIPDKCPFANAAAAVVAADIVVGQGTGNAVGNRISVHRSVTAAEMIFVSRPAIFDRGFIAFAGAGYISLSLTDRIVIIPLEIQSNLGAAQPVRLRQLIPGFGKRSRL